MPMPATERVVILGGSGFLGGHLTRFLRMLDPYQVLSYASSDCNLLDPAQVEAGLRVADDRTSIVFASDITRLAEDSWEALVKNITMVHQFLAAAKNRPLGSVIFLSSADVYGMPPSEHPIRETTPPRPNCCHGVSKLSGEAILMMAPLRPWPCTVLRLPGVYGMGDRGRSVIGQFVERISRHQPLRLTAGGTSLRDYVEVGDACRVVQHFVRCPSAGVFNVATGESLPIREIAREVAESLGVTPNLEWDAARGPRDGDLAFDTSLLRSVCPHLEFTPLRKGIRDYVSQRLSGGCQPEGVTRLTAV